MRKQKQKKASRRAGGKRDEGGMKCPEICIENAESLLPIAYKWEDSLKNRRNKKSTVAFIVKMFMETAVNLLQEEQVLYISSESEVWQVECGKPAIRLNQLTNNHDEADPRIFFIAHSL